MVIRVLWDLHSAKMMKEVATERPEMEEGCYLIHLVELVVFQNLPEEKEICLTLAAAEKVLDQTVEKNQKVEVEKLLLEEELKVKEEVVNRKEAMVLTAAVVMNQPVG